MTSDTPALPTALYRLQIHGEFPLSAARKLVPYLHGLGISHLYLSPLFRPRSGSRHGYDVVDYSILHPEAGGMPELEALVAELRRYDMGIILDIVPNHCALTLENPWIRELLEYGPLSERFTYFDIYRQNPRSGSGVIVLPLLEEDTEALIGTGRIKLSLESDGLSLRSPAGVFPLNPFSYPLLLREFVRTVISDALRELVTPAMTDLDLCREEFLAIRKKCADDFASPSFRRDVGPLLKMTRGVMERLRTNVFADPDFCAAFRIFADSDTGSDLSARSDHGTEILNLNSLPENAERSEDSGSPVRHLLAEQWYRLVPWRTGFREINYRRFFNINHLIALRMEDPEVFRQTHGLIKTLLERKLIQGVRVDHIDGLRHPGEYLRRLQEPNDFKSRYLIVEKILSAGESLPPEWPVAGSTGYDFLNHCDALFIAAAGLNTLRRFYGEIGAPDGDFETISRKAQIRIQEEVLVPEFNQILGLLRELARRIEPGVHARADLQRALQELSAALPVYRTYITGIPDPATGILIRQAGTKAARHLNTGETQALDFIIRMLTGLSPAKKTEETVRLEFVHCWQQFTGPVMAKGVEDTALFQQTTLSAQNEVGGNPDRNAFASADFHDFIRRRLEGFPDSLNASSTHDTKRSEDSRARLHLLTEFPDEWERYIRGWLRRHSAWVENHVRESGDLNRPVFADRGYENQMRPHVSTILIVYQYLFAIWPGANPDHEELARRLKAQAVKSCREAKIHSSWDEPNAGYEKEVSRFIDRLFADQQFQRELDVFVSFTEKTFVLRSLARTLLKITAPGIPEFYQGNELWNFRLTDPDNRTPVDFERCEQALDRFPAPDADSGELTAFCRELLAGAVDGRIKLYLIRQALALRLKNPGLFARGEYLPLFTDREDIVAFARRLDADYALIIVPRFGPHRSSGNPEGTSGKSSDDEGLPFPPELPRSWINQFSGQRLHVSGKEEVLKPGRLFVDFPVALYRTDH